MLPKVATTILHSTSRAAAAVQNQTHAIRNVLNLQSSTPASGSSKNGPGSSSSGGWGPNSGGSKYNTGSRFQSGYHGASRAVSQAHAISANDIGLAQSDENTDEIPQKRVTSITSPRRSRLRSNSLGLVLSSEAQSERNDKIGVLQTVQLHARSRHAFAHSAEDNEARPASPPLTRSRSSSVALPPKEDLSSPAVPSPQSSKDVLSTDPASPQTVLPPPSNEEETSSFHFRTLSRARDSRNPYTVAEALSNFRSTAVEPIVPEFNMALEAIQASRPVGEPLTLLIETYNDMISRGLLPNLRTYVLVLRALTERDAEVQYAIRGLEMRQKWRGDIVNREDDALLEKYRGENNFTSAMAVFQAILSLGPSTPPIPYNLLTNLLHSCVENRRVDSALTIWTYIESLKGLKPSAAMFKHLITVFSQHKNIKAAQEIFKSYRGRCQRDEIGWGREGGNESGSPSAAHVMVYNAMIEAFFVCEMPDLAISLLDEMIDTSTSVKEPVVRPDVSTLPDFRPSAPPTPSPSTFSTIIAGFCNADDTESAVVWFKRLLSQKHSPRGIHQSTLTPTRPDVAAWRTIIEHLSLSRKTDELNELVTILKQQNLEEIDNLELRTVDRALIFDANMKKVQELIDADEKLKAKEHLDRLLAWKMVDPTSMRHDQMLQNVWNAYISIGHPVEALKLFKEFYDAAQQIPLENSRQRANILLRAFVKKVYANYQGGLPFDEGLLLARLVSREVIPYNPAQAAELLHAYATEGAKEKLSNMDLHDLTTLLGVAAYLEPSHNDPVQRGIRNYAFQGLFSLLTDLPKDKLKDVFTAIRPSTLLEPALQAHGFDAVREWAAHLDPSFRAALDSVATSQASEDGESVSSLPLSDSTAPTSVTSEAAQVYGAPKYFVDDSLTHRLDTYLYRQLDEHSLRQTCKTLVKAFLDGLNRQVIPSPHSVGKLCATLGRIGDIQSAKMIYNRMQPVIATTEGAEQAEIWFLVEDSMLIALAQAGDIDGAHVHRLRMLGQGRPPSADAYGGLILHVRDTTDDTSNALALFQESQMHNVVPNQYLYNNIISKLAKARKAEQALVLFKEMRAKDITPSSITYGALIGACARVGDVESAENLFEEMVMQPKFKPRVPPYNTMMQLYTTTKPNKERALSYYYAMLNAKVKPSPYTYKLLMDVHVLEPVDIQQVESVFQTIVNSPVIELQAGHFATLINAYGCIMKDLDKALQIYHTMSSYPRAPPMEAHVAEAMVNVAVTHRRMDLVPSITEQMTAAGVHMTAYVVNSIIRGHALTGALEEARELFETLVDPPTGVAASHNHASHDPTTAVPVNPMEPVYREPSTWEVMVRAELGAGHRDRAIALLERLKTRQYPEAVFNRISGILVDHSQIPMP